MTQRSEANETPSRWDERRRELIVLCLRVGATLRVVHLGPGMLAATPAGAVTCYYEAGIHACQIRRPASVVLTATLDSTSRSVTAVAVR